METTATKAQQSFSEYISYHLTYLAPENDIANQNDVAHLEDISTMCMESYPCRGHTIKIHYKDGSTKIFEHNSNIIYLLYNYCGKECPKHYKKYQKYVKRNKEWFHKITKIIS